MKPTAVKSMARPSTFRHPEDGWMPVEPTNLESSATERFLPASEEDDQL